MIKGHVCIDLHNHNSGFTERIEADNLVTNAVQEVISATFGLKGSTDLVLPIYKKALGGLMLFDNHLDEHQTNTHFPESAHLVGYAMQNERVSDTLRGSYNATESHMNADGFTSVWDFGTSQANGTIKSLARTLDTGSQALHGKVYEATLSDYGYNVPVLFTSGNQELLAIGTRNATQALKFSHGGKFKLPITKFASNDTPCKARILDNDMAEITLPSYTGFSSYAITAIKSGYDGYAYIAYTKANSSGNGVLKYIKIKTDDQSFTTSGEMSVECENCHFYGGGYGAYGGEDFNYATICAGYAYVIDYSRTGVYIINLSNTTDIKHAQFADGVTANQLLPYPSGVVMAYNGVNKETYIYRDGTVVTDNVANASRNTIDTGVVGMMVDSSKIEIHGGYLGTICNLSSDVVKTSAQSMKVTYTLTNV